MSERNFEAPMDDQDSVEGGRPGLDFSGEFGERETGDAGFAGEHGERVHEGRSNQSRESAFEEPLS